MDEQIKQYQDHLSQLRILKEKLIGNLQKLEGTLEGLRKIFTLTKRNRDKSDQSRRKKEGRRKAKMDKLKRAKQSALCVGQVLKKNSEEGWLEENIDRGNLKKLKKKKHCHGLKFILENETIDKKCRVILQNKLDEWIYKDSAIPTSDDNSNTGDEDSSNSDDDE